MPSTPTATPPSATANHKVAIRHSRVMATAEGPSAPKATSSTPITASVPPSPPGRNDSAPASTAMA